ncbi:nonribosomal peptide synthetase DhbF [Micromonospora nigra]|uniref:Nonribosomal peptide synthetase DhbF n=1 Tax=Micromonospora nigra TaxID=145857 RepID=A0A1C6RC87_9ACTN|nr:amino acid adenylation domain-containing protein [Micromonospora nigra]SCL14620.1 nonribosomal peptide synthetase DhbF [Micromonospora nigra]
MTTHPRPDSLSDVLRVSARRHAERTALVDVGVRLTYRDLDGCVDALAARFRRAGVRPGDRVGLHVARGPLALVGSAALMRAGAAYLPLDVAQPAARLRYIAEDSGLRLVVCDEAGSRGEFGAGVSRLTVDADDLGRRASTDPDDEPAILTGSGAYVMYTSGSTGAPKGVEVTHANVLALLDDALPLFSLGPDEVWPLQHGHGFDISVWEMWAGIAVGATLVAVTGPATEDVEQLAELLARHRPTRLHIVPSVFRHLAEVVAEDDVRIPLRNVTFCGEAVNYQAMRTWADSQPGPAPQWFNSYGITETTVYNTLAELSAADIARADPATLIGAGYPSSPVVVRTDDGPAAAGAVGEIYIGGRQVSPGYLGRPELTAQRFVSLPDQPGIWYRTGDLGRTDPDGRLRYVGRIDEQVKIRGFRVELGEIDVAMRGIEWIRDAACVVHTSALGEPMLVAFVVPAQDAQPAPQALLARLRAELAARLPAHMLPNLVVPVPVLPLNANGKTNRRALAAELGG